MSSPDEPNGLASPAPMSPKELRELRLLAGSTWSLAAERDGSVRLRRTPTAQRARARAYLMLILFGGAAFSCGGMLFWDLTARGTSIPGGWEGMLVLLSSVAFVLLGAWVAVRHLPGLHDAAIGVEEWRVAPERLEIVKEPPLRRRHIVGAAEIVVRHAPIHHGARPFIRGESRIYIRSGDGSLRLDSLDQQLLGDEYVAALAHLLKRVTGWPIRFE
jgi:hypothetical protein